MQKQTLGFQGLSKPQVAAVSGAGIWKTLNVLGTGSVSNTVADPLQEGFKVADLAAPAAYYSKSKKFDNLQLVVRYSTESNEFNFVSLIHDKDGNPRISASNTYRIEECQAIQDFKIPDSDAVIAKGTVMLKAYPVE